MSDHGSRTTSFGYQREKSVGLRVISPFRFAAKLPIKIILTKVFHPSLRRAGGGAAQLWPEPQRRERTGRGGGIDDHAHFGGGDGLPTQPLARF